MGLISVSPILPLETNLKGIYMPIYEYKCTCGATFETLQGFDEPKLKKCNKDIHECSEEGELTRLISKPTLLKLGHLSDKKLREDLGDNIDS